MTLRRGSGRVEARLAPTVAKTHVPSSATAPAVLVRAALGERADHFDTDIVVQVPPTAGLGTSAAIAVATLRARNTLDDRRMDQDALLQAAIAVEDAAHGASSGLDPAICLEGGLVRFSRLDGRPSLERLQPASSFHLAVGVRGSHGGTARRVRAVKQFERSTPSLVDAAMATLGAAAEVGTDALVDGALERAGAAMNVAHGVLSGLGLVGDEVEALVRQGRAGGALGAKMSGAGGDGGAFFALAPDIRTADEIVRRWHGDGAEAWVETAA